MAGDVIRTAINRRGPIFCPDCRARKCDYCGVVFPDRVNRVVKTGDGLCASCENGSVDLFNPDHRFAFQVWQKLPH